MQSGVASFWRELTDASDPTAIALRDGNVELSRGELADRISDRRSELHLARRSMVVLSGETSTDWVVTYLALLAAGHVPLLAGDHLDRLTAAWNPSAVVVASPSGIQVEYAAAASGAAGGADEGLHPELALLLSTSGSTGDPKLVRLSHAGLSSNAHAISSFLALGPDDCGITSLPLHYCYGLSVLHSHLVAGASVVLSTASVVDPCFRDALQRHDVTNLAGVPHTFDLLERAGPDSIAVSSLRFVTQAGGKLPVDAVRRWIDRTEAWGVDFIVMYGQTEATARMAYLPPTVSRRHPGAIGVPIEGGSFRLAPLGADDMSDVGELVYSGPNVMLGYATGAADLAQGRTTGELWTGDLARFHADDGVYEIVGRRARFIKPFGLRIDLDALECDLGGAVAVAGDDDGIVVCAPECIDTSELVDDIAARTGLPRAGVIAIVSPIPRTASDKVDYSAITRDGRAERQQLRDGIPGAAESVSTATSAAVMEVFTSVLGRPGVMPTDTFVSLGGDSLSYIECSIRLEHVLGRLPADWHHLPIEQLAPQHRGRHMARIDTTLVLRAIAICCVVSTHMRLSYQPGGAHLLLAVVGYNLARFMMPIRSTRDRVLAGARTVARVAVPTVLWVAAGLALGASYGLGTLLLINNYTGPRSHRQDQWHFWFIEVLVHVTIVITALLAVPAFHRTERRFPYATPLVVVALLLTLRWEWAQMGDWYNMRFRTHGVAWFVALGWLIQRSSTRTKRAVTAAAILLAVPGFFDYAPRERFIAATLLVLLVAPEIPFPRAIVRPVAMLAAASMWIYITHFTFWPPLVDLLGTRRAYVPTILAGLAVWAAVERASPLIARRWRSMWSAMRPAPTLQYQPPTARMSRT